MRHIAATIAAVTAAGTAACSIPDKQLYPPFGCNQQAPSPRAQDPVVIRGRVIDPDMSKPVGGALIEIILDGAKDPIGHTTSAADGSFVISQRTGAMPLHAYFKVSHASEDPRDPNLDTYFYPAAPLTDDLDDVELQMITRGQATAFMQVVNVDLDLTRIMLAITAVDCNDVPQGGATVSTDPTGAPIHYVVDGDQGPVPSLSATVTDRQSGTGFAVNLPITDPATNTSAITINATMPLPSNSSLILTLRSHAITGVVPGALIQADIQP